MRLVPPAGTWCALLLVLAIVSSRASAGGGGISGTSGGDATAAVEKRFEVPQAAADIVEVERATLDACTASSGGGGGGDGGGDGGLSSSSSKGPPPPRRLIQVGTMTVSLPVTWANIGSISLLLVLAVVGCVAVWRILTRQKCRCKLCGGTYVIRDALGKGGFGRIYSSHRSDDADTPLVLKMVQLDSVTELDSAQLEAKELRALRHPFIVRHVDDFVHNTWGLDGGESLHVCIAMEWCAMDLRTAIAEQDPEPGDPAGAGAGAGAAGEGEGEGEGGSSSNTTTGPFPEERVLKWLAQLVGALAYCHRKDVSHRDVKSQNVFLTSNDDIRLGDFGLCRQAPGMMTFSEGGTDTYMPPEVMLGQKLDGKKVDVWCLGLVLYELLSLTFVCEHVGLLGALAIKSAAAVPAMLENIPEEAGYSTEIRKVALRMLAVDPAERPSMEAILRKKLLARHTKPHRQGRQGGGGAAGGAAGGGKPKKLQPHITPRSFLKKVSSAEDLRRAQQQQQQQRRR